MLFEIPLTKEQQDFATQHHSLVYKFLNSNHLSEDEFYDVVIFGYLKAVNDYFNVKHAQKYSFSTIANRQMQFSLYDYLRAQSRIKRKANTISIHLALCADGTPLEEAISIENDCLQQLELELLIHDLANHISKQQMDIVRDKIYGYGIREISHRKQLSMKRIHELLEEVRVTISKLCSELN